YGSLGCTTLQRCLGRCATCPEGRRCRNCEARQLPTTIGLGRKVNRAFQRVKENLSKKRKLPAVRSCRNKPWESVRWRLDTEKSRFRIGEFLFTNLSRGGPCLGVVYLAP